VTLPTFMNESGKADEETAVGFLEKLTSIFSIPCHEKPHPEWLKDLSHFIKTTIQDNSNAEVVKQKQREVEELQSTLENRNQKAYSEVLAMELKKSECTRLRADLREVKKALAEATKVKLKITEERNITAINSAHASLVQAMSAENSDLRFKLSMGNMEINQLKEQNKRGSEQINLIEQKLKEQEAAAGSTKSDLKKQVVELQDELERLKIKSQYTIQEIKTNSLVQATAEIRTFLLAQTQKLQEIIDETSGPKPTPKRGRKRASTRGESSVSTLENTQVPIAKITLQKLETQVRLTGGEKLPTNKNV